MSDQFEEQENEIITRLMKKFNQNFSLDPNEVTSENDVTDSESDIQTEQLPIPLPTLDLPVTSPLETKQKNYFNSPYAKNYQTEHKLQTILQKLNKQDVQSMNDISEYDIRRIKDNLNLSEIENLNIASQLKAPANAEIKTSNVNQVHDFIKMYSKNLPTEKNLASYTNDFYKLKNLTDSKTNDNGSFKIDFKKNVDPPKTINNNTRRILNNIYNRSKHVPYLMDMETKNIGGLLKKVAYNLTPKTSQHQQIRNTNSADSLRSRREKILLQNVLRSQNWGPKLHETEQRNMQRNLNGYTQLPVTPSIIQPLKQIFIKPKEKYESKSFNDIYNNHLQAIVADLNKLGPYYTRSYPYLQRSSTNLNYIPDSMSKSWTSMNTLDAKIRQDWQKTLKNYPNIFPVFPPIIIPSFLNNPQFRHKRDTTSSNESTFSTEQVTKEFEKFLDAYLKLLLTTKRKKMNLNISTEEHRHVKHRTSPRNGSKKHKKRQLKTKTRNDVPLKTSTNLKGSFSAKTAASKMLEISNMPELYTQTVAIDAFTLNLSSIEDKFDTISNSTDDAELDLEYSKRNKYNVNINTTPMPRPDGTTSIILQKFTETLQNLKNNLGLNTTKSATTQTDKSKTIFNEFMTTLFPPKQGTTLQTETEVFSKLNKYLTTNEIPKTSIKDSIKNTNLSEKYLDNVSKEFKGGISATNTDLLQNQMTNKNLNLDVKLQGNVGKQFEDIASNTNLNLDINLQNNVDKKFGDIAGNATGLLNNNLTDKSLNLGIKLQENVTGDNNLTDYAKLLTKIPEFSFTDILQTLTTQALEETQTITTESPTKNYNKQSNHIIESITKKLKVPKTGINISSKIAGAADASLEAGRNAKVKISGANAFLNADTGIKIPGANALLNAQRDAKIKMPTGKPILNAGTGAKIKISGGRNIGTDNKHYKNFFNNLSSEIGERSNFYEPRNESEEFGNKKRTNQKPKRKFLSKTSRRTINSPNTDSSTKTSSQQSNRSDKQESLEDSSSPQNVIGDTSENIASVESNASLDIIVKNMSSKNRKQNININDLLSVNKAANSGESTLVITDKNKKKLPAIVVLVYPEGVPDIIVNKTNQKSSKIPKFSTRKHFNKSKLNSKELNTLVTQLTQNDDHKTTDANDSHITNIIKVFPTNADYIMPPKLEIDLDDSTSYKTVTNLEQPGGTNLTDQQNDLTFSSESNTSFVDSKTDATSSDVILENEKTTISSLFTNTANIVKFR